ncbi:hypothetical protein [uncultured Marivirga sp.]|uniref:hypothetical protein n=1 Tax=uncultured Marivirga sp. TaxID=1123707 RepID=UPI0030ED0E58
MQDGKHIAIALDRHGNYGVFLYNIEDGPTSQLSFHSAHDIPQRCTVDGKSILFTSGRKMNAENSQFPYSRFS